MYLDNEFLIAPIACSSYDGISSLFARPLVISFFKLQYFNKLLYSLLSNSFLIIELNSSYFFSYSYHGKLSFTQKFLHTQYLLSYICKFPRVIYHYYYLKTKFLDKKASRD